MITKIQQGMIADQAVTLNTLDAGGTPTIDKFLDGAFSWQTQPSSLNNFDLGVINAQASNLIFILLQAAPIDFNNLTLGYDAGSLA